MNRIGILASDDGLTERPLVPADSYILDPR